MSNDTKTMVIGTGRMGSALARAFSAAGHETRAWNRTRARAEPLTEHGVRVVDELVPGLAGVDLVVVNVIDYDAALQVLGAPDVARALSGKALAQLTSGSPSDARRAEAWAKEHAVAYLDGAIMATPDFIGQQDCTLLYSGASAAFAEHAAALRALGGRTLFLGSNVALAATLDNALLALLWGNLFGVLTGAALCEAEGYPLGSYREHLDAVRPVIDGSVGDLVRRLEARDFGGEHSQATIEACAVAIRHLVTICREHGVDGAQRPPSIASCRGPSTRATPLTTSRRSRASCAAPALSRLRRRPHPRPGRRRPGRNSRIAPSSPRLPGLAGCRMAGTPRALDTAAERAPRGLPRAARWATYSGARPGISKRAESRC